MTNIFHAKSIVKSNYKIGEPITLDFELTNVTKDDYFVLKWNNPLEGLFSSYVSVKLNGKEIRYDGFFLKKGNPVAQSYVLVKAGESVSSTINLANAYYFSEVGEYEIIINTRIHDYFKKASDSNVCEPKKIDSHTSLTLASSNLKFDIAKDKNPIETTGMIQRAKGGKEPLLSKVEENSKLLTSKFSDVVSDSSTPTDTIAKPMAPDFVSLSSEFPAIARTAVTTAHNTAYRWSQIATTCSDFNPVHTPNLYLTWFGTAQQGNTSYYQEVNNLFYLIFNTFNTTSIQYNLGYYDPETLPVDDGGPLKYDTIAASISGGDMMYIFGKFFTNAADQANTVIHELTHMLNSTVEDVFYNQAACKILAKEEPRFALINASNYAYYCQSLPTLIENGMTVFHQGGGNNGELWFSTSFIDDVWYPDTQIGKKAVMSCSPDVLYDFWGQYLQCFYQVKRNAEDLHYQTFIHGQWSGQSSIHNAKASISPSVVMYNGTAFCFYQGHGNSGQLWFAYQAGGIGWHNTQIPKVVMSCSPSVVVSNNVFYCLFQGGGNDQKLYFVYKNSHGSPSELEGKWSGNKNISQAGTIKSSPSVITFGNKLYCFYRGKDDNLYYVYATISDSLTASSWSHSVLVPNVQVSASPRAMVVKNSIYCFHQGKDSNGELWYNAATQNASGELEWCGDKMMKNVTMSSSPGVIPFGLNIDLLNT